MRAVKGFAISIRHFGLHLQDPKRRIFGMLEEKKGHTVLVKTGPPAYAVCDAHGIIAHKIGIFADQDGAIECL